MTTLAANIIVRHVRVDFGEEVDVYLFPFESLPAKYRNGEFISPENLDRALSALGFKSADPYSLDAVNKEDLALSDQHPNCTQWKDEDDCWYFAAFGYRIGRLPVLISDRISHRAFVWDDSWLFAGERK